MADQTPVLLACDTTQSACSVAVKIGAAEARQNMLEMARGHAEALMPLMQDFMAAEGLAMADLTHLAVTVGPGTFTGTRVGLSAMRGLALALNLPLVGIGSLQAMALASDAPRPRLVAIDARRDSFYCQAFSVEGRILSPPQALGLSDAAALIGGQQQVAVIGTGKSALAAWMQGFCPMPRRTSRKPAMLPRWRRNCRRSNGKPPRPHRFICARPMPHCPIKAKPCCARHEAKFD